MKKSVSVSNLTLNLWLDFVRPALRAVNMLEEVPAKDEWHEFTAEVIEEATAEESNAKPCATFAPNSPDWPNWKRLSTPLTVSCFARIPRDAPGSSACSGR